MKIQYNIYRMENNSIRNFLRKIKKAGLVKQGKIKNDDHTLVFFFSENNKGHDVKWWDTYKVFSKNTASAPKNIFHYGLLAAIPKKDKKYIYLASLGKSHFYLSKFIDCDFGIEFAVNLTHGQSILLKKSRYFTGIRKGAITSYQEFDIGNFEPGESVDHLKLKAEDKKTWGDSSIICSDSIQISQEIKPEYFSSLIKKIESVLTSKPLISIPKLEKENDQTAIDELDLKLVESIKKGEAIASTSDFMMNGSHITLSHECDNFYIIKLAGRKTEKELLIGNQLDIEKIKSFITTEGINDINQVAVRYTDSNEIKWKKKLKEVLDFRILHEDIQYTTKNGDWYSFNEKFMEFLKKSLESIETIKMDDLDEDDYINWKLTKEASINNGTSTNKITYREYYFNEKLAQEKGYLLLDRKNHTIKTLASVGNNYQVELADLYANEEAISLKISEDKAQLIYNAFQSLTALELYCQDEIKTKNKIKKVALWIVHEDEISSIFDFNSIQLLLAIENWRAKAQSYGLGVKIYHSKHINVKKKATPTT